MLVNCIIQARMSSKRLYGKVLKKINGEEILKHVLNQVKKTKFITSVIVATSKNKEDDKIELFCKKNNIKLYRGSLNNVYLRYKKLINENNCDYFIRICADSPLIEVNIINQILKIAKKNKFQKEIYTNIFPRTFPKGLSVEMINTNTFLKSYKKIRLNYHKEHITSYFYKNYMYFKILNYKSVVDYSDINFSIDTKNDFNKVKRLIKIKGFLKKKLKEKVNIYKSI
jgi:spore coat polysaccharide biosynthesis protein SpsF